MEEKEICQYGSPIFLVLRWPFTLTSEYSWYQKPSTAIDVPSGQAIFATTRICDESNGLETVNNIGDEAFTLVFNDPLTKRENHQLVFRKNGFLVELKTNESRSAKTPCPCYEMDKLKKLAENVAGKL